MHLIYSGLILLLLSGCFALSKEHYQAVDGLQGNYKVLEDRDRQLARELDTVQHKHGDQNRGQER